MTALVVSVFGAYYSVIPEGSKEIILATIKGKNRLQKLSKKENPFAVGDLVSIDLLNDGNAVISDLLKRKNVIKSSTTRTQVLGANIDQVIFVGAWKKKPKINLGLFDRVIVEANCCDIPVSLIMNKKDLKVNQDLDTKLNVYRGIGIKVYSEVLLSSVSSSLKQSLVNKRVLLLGESGSGKSTFLNAVAAKALQATGEVSRFDTGKHTTTNPVLHQLEMGAQVIDIPGFREFGLAHRDSKDVINGFPEFFPLNCKFKDCLHVGEPGCEIANKVEKYKIRYESYKMILSSLNQLWKPRRGDSFN